ncbi:hypothetical protein [Alteraurantiacibacter aquimixticola]|uniref:Uncharacterized protein n=1 Tax=Alteraurantiacibacter aquimixticola TaxID=2489173 RepID=A0A4T3F2V4_9SPHN|nr:hypothetical protein [Alteraurantiacibacter aquimixticola]TIX51566.1 hypothetical protein E5222_03685 [Alteraurantiacibacter aquimixticola]
MSALRKTTLALLGGAALASSGAWAQEDLTVLPAPSDDYQPELTAWGEPDFRGGWPIDHLNGRTPLQRAAEHGDRQLLTQEEFAERTGMVEALEQRYQNEDSTDTMGIGHWAEVAAANRRTSWITSPSNGQLPAFTAEGQRLSDAMRSTWVQGQPFDTWHDFDSWDRCISRGLPASMFPFMYNNGMRIFQSPGLVAIQMEMVHETRLIPTDGSAPIPSQIDHWLGESRGEWEDHNTLKVVTTNFKPGPSATNIGTTGSPRENDTPVSNQARLVERFHMVGPDEIIYEFTWEDPVVFTQPWSARLEWQRDEDYEIYEYACHEGNVQIRNFITASRAERAEAAAAAVGGSE